MSLAASSPEAQGKSGRPFPFPVELLGLLGLGLLWWLLTLPAMTGTPFLGQFSPGAALPALTRLLAEGTLWEHLLVSLKRVMVGLGLAFVIGAPLGLLVGSSRLLERATEPAFQLLRMISPLSWMPLAVMVLGVGDAPIYLLLALAGLWPILFAAAGGVKNLNASWLDLGRSLSATRGEMFWHITLPGILGSLLQGVRLAIGTLWILLVPCEMLGVRAGLGYFILDTRDRLAYPELMATVVLIGLLGYLLDAAARWLVGRFQGNT
ncbi:ABC transporter permease [Deinococcus sp. Marseille-Q6407]|uniref:ABC transporter permease n=1 Tax=Deinococcus sp. Marseille-Q6407 TaxID=2969223 RepID=UPI0021C07847|nr:ABC transporter permease [Deinococcus sp. Marseille-Q6407]